MEVIDKEGSATEEYEAFSGQEVRYENRRIWLGPPDLKYVVRQVAIVNLGRPHKIHPSENERIPERTRREVKWGTSKDHVHTNLKKLGPHSLTVLAKKLNMPRATVEYACKTHPDIIRIKKGVWEAV